MVHRALRERALGRLLGVAGYNFLYVFETGPSDRVPLTARRGEKEPRTMTKRFALALLVAVAVGACSAQSASTAVPGTSQPEGVPTQAPPTQAPTPVVTPAPTPTPSETANPTPVMTANPTQEALLDANLTKWTNKEIRITDAQRWLECPDTTLCKIPANIVDNTSMNTDKWTPNFQAYVLGGDVVNTKEGNTNLVLYLGFEDKNKVQYYAPANLGPMGDQYYSIFMENPTRQIFSSPSNAAKHISNPDIYSMLNSKLSNDTIEFAGIGYLLVDKSQLQEGRGYDVDQIYNSIPFAVKFAKFSVIARDQGLDAAYKQYPDMRNSINHKVETLDTTNTPYARSFVSPRTDLSPPDYTPLPVTVNSDAWFTAQDSLVLAPGSYTVSYTATGTCDLNLSVTSLGSVSVPVAHQSVESESVSGSASVTIAKTGSYLLDPGSSGCDWSATISQP